MSYRVVGRTYHINALFDGRALTVDLAFQMVDGPRFTLRERKLIITAVNFSTLAHVSYLSGDSEDDFRFRIAGVRNLEEATLLVRTVASHADTRLREDRWDLCSSLYDSRIEVVGNER